MSAIDFSQFPTTRYQGSKRKILSWIYDVLKDLEFETVLDGFGGSGTVSYLFKRMGKAVTFNDILKCNYYSAKALIENNWVTFSDQDQENLLKTKIEGNPKTVQRLFKDIYFLDHENEWLDDMAYGIMNMNHYTGKVLEYKKAVAYHSLFQASLIKRPYNLFHRKNLNLRIADVNRSFGNKATWDKSFIDHFTAFIKETNRVVFDSGNKCKALNESIFDISPSPYDLVYLDPPYFSENSSNETSDYLRCYHFLEGLCNYEHWESLIDLSSINRRFEKTYLRSAFSSVDKIATYRKLFEKFRHSKIVLSYKRGGIPSIETLVNLMKDYKQKVLTRDTRYRYALSKQNGNDKTNREVLIIGL